MKNWSFPLYMCLHYNKVYIYWHFGAPVIWCVFFYLKSKGYEIASIFDM